MKYWIPIFGLYLVLRDINTLSDIDFPNTIAFNILYHSVLIATIFALLII